MIGWLILGGLGYLGYRLYLHYFTLQVREGDYMVEIRPTPNGIWNYKVNVKHEGRYVLSDKGVDSRLGARFVVNRAVRLHRATRTEVWL